MNIVLQTNTTKLTLIYTMTTFVLKYVIVEIKMDVVCQRNQLYFQFEFVFVLRIPMLSIPINKVKILSTKDINSPQTKMWRLHFFIQSLIFLKILKGFTHLTLILLPKLLLEFKIINIIYLKWLSNHCSFSNIKKHSLC